MLSFLPAPVIGVINSILLGINTLFWCILLYIPAILKLIIPITGFRVLCTKVIIWIAEAWVACNTGWMKLTHGSNGWFWLQTARDRYVMWSAGDFTRQQFSFDDEKPDASAPAIAAGVYSYGQWTIRVTAAELSIEHRANPHRVVLVASSDGFVRLQGLRNRGDLTVRPNDQLAQER